MWRREFITLLCGGVAWPLVAPRTTNASTPSRWLRTRRHSPCRNDRIKSHFHTCTRLCAWFARLRLDRGSDRSDRAAVGRGRPATRPRHFRRADRSRRRCDRNGWIAMAARSRTEGNTNNPDCPLVRCRSRCRRRCTKPRPPRRQSHRSDDLDWRRTHRKATSIAQGACSHRRAGSLHRKQ